MFDEPGHGSAVAFELVTDAIQPFDLRKSDHPLGGEGCLTCAIARQSLHRLVTLTGRCELEGRVCPHCFEHFV